MSCLWDRQPTSSARSEVPPPLPECLRLKRTYDPDERFQSEWYRYYKGMFADLP